MGNPTFTGNALITYQGIGTIGLQFLFLETKTFDFQKTDFSQTTFVFDQSADSHVIPIYRNLNVLFFPVFINKFG